MIRGVGVGSWVIETPISVVALAEGAVNISNGFSIGNLSESADDDGISRVHVDSLGPEAVQELGPFLVDGEGVGEAGVVCKNQFKLTLLLGQFQGIEDGRGVGAVLEAA